MWSQACPTRSPSARYRPRGRGTNRPEPDLQPTGRSFGATGRFRERWAVREGYLLAGVVFRLADGVGKGLFLLVWWRALHSTPVGADPAPHRFIQALYYVILVGFVGSVSLILRIDRSPFGMALRAIRDNETRAAFVGIRVRRYRWYAFVISAIFTGLAGGLYGQIDRQATLTGA